MKSKAWVLAAVLSVLGAGSLASAADVEKKFRIGFSLGFFNGQDEVESDAGNVLTLVEQDFTFHSQFTDPRDDSSAFGALEIRPGSMLTVTGQYAVNKVLLIEAAVGYQKTDVGQIEVQAQFNGVDVPDLERFQFRTYRIGAGDLERVPITVSAIARFRPRAKFNPYFGVGVGYTIIGFETAPEFDILSRNIDASLGGQAEVTEATFGSERLLPPGSDQVGDLSGATVDARDTFEYHLAGGAEYGVKRDWSIVVDVRWVRSSRSLRIGFNGGKDLGLAVPQLLDYATSPAGTTVYGPVLVTQGGIIDGGRLWPDLESEIGQDLVEMNPIGDFDTIRDEYCLASPGLCEAVCASNPGECVFVPRPDGQLDPGFYYVQGGEIDYGGFGAQVGFRYTF